MPRRRLAIHIKPMRGAIFFHTPKVIEKVRTSHWHVAPGGPCFSWPRLFQMKCVRQHYSPNLIFFSNKYQKKTISYQERSFSKPQSSPPQGSTPFSIDGTPSYSITVVEIKSYIFLKKITKCYANESDALILNSIELFEYFRDIPVQFILSRVALYWNKKNMVD